MLVAEQLAVLSENRCDLFVADGETLVVVAHGVVCKVLLLNLLPEYTLADWHLIGPMRNVAVSELVREHAVWRSVRLNELSKAVAAL